jgi:hypothetical protein
MTSTIIYSQELQSLIDSTIKANEDRVFKPTYLYIKQHSVTGKLYFGKTERPHDEMLCYEGSGNYWTDHFNIHGKQYIETIWYCLFYDVESIIEFALSYCFIHNIGQGDTSLWTNLVLENGVSGGSKGNSPSIETRAKWSKQRTGKGNSMFGKHHSSETKLLLSQMFKGSNNQFYQIPRSEDVKAKISESLKGIKHPIVTCPHCNKSGTVSNMTRWHFDNCKTVRATKNVDTLTCPHCNKSGESNGMKRYHFDNCKSFKL